MLLRDYFPVNTCTGYSTELFVTVIGQEHVLLVHLQSDTFSTEESSFMAALFQEIGVRRVLMQIANPIPTSPELKEQHKHKVEFVSDVYNHSVQARPLAYLHSMTKTPTRSSFTFQFNPEYEVSYMSFAGPSIPSSGEISIAKQFGATYTGTFSLMPFYAFRHVNIGVTLCVTHEDKSIPADYLKQWLIQTSTNAPYQHVPICNAEPNLRLIKKKVVLYEHVQEAVDFVKQKLPQLDELHGKISTGVIDLDLGLSFDSFSSLICSIPLESLPHWEQVYYNSRRALEMPGKQQLKLIQVQNTGEYCLVCDGPLAYADEPNYISESSFLVRILQELGIQKLFLASTMMTAYHKDHKNEYAPLHKNGSIVLLEDHVSLIGENPMVGRNEDRWGPRFYDMSDVYSEKINEFIVQKAKDLYGEKNPELVPQLAKCLFHGNSNFREYSKLERTSIAQRAELHVLGTHGCREIIVARHHEQEKKAVHIIFAGLVVSDGAYDDSSLDKFYTPNRQAIAHLLSLAVSHHIQ